LERLGIKGGVQDDDPVFLLSTEQWNEISDGAGEGENYLLVYDFFSDSRIKEKAKEIAKDHHLRIFAICPFRQPYADKNFTTAGPETFVSLVKNANFVVTNSFHAIAFCMIFQTEYCFIERPDGLNERITDLVKRQVHAL
jgi:hypothetical protein